MIPDVDQPVTTEIDRISSDGNGIVLVNGKTINIGPVRENQVGEEVEVKVVTSTFGVCHTDPVTKPNYEARLLGLADTEYWLDAETPPEEIMDISLEYNTFSGEILRMSDSGNGLLRDHINIGPVTQDSVGEEIEATKVTPQFAVCHTNSVTVADYREEFLELVTPGYWSDDYPSPPEVFYARAQEEQDADPGSRIQESPETNSVTEGDSGSPKESEFSSTDESDLTELREKAKKASVNVTTEVTTISRQSTREYTRSSAVVEYVKSRADGECEGCGEPAPFQSTTGEPYLHAHHLHELSQGGADTPDTVVALCPNCHYRVHHGEDGEEYNQGLLEMVQKLENG